MKKSFYSNGKLLLTGEYTVLDGTIALAVPTRFGQYLEIEQTNQHNEIEWISLDYDATEWFKARIKKEHILLNKHEENDSEILRNLVKILHEAAKQNSDFLNSTIGLQITTRLTFPKYWGLGTSSTLINNISQWLEIDPYLLLKNTFGGSGYDIACAQNDTAILYQLKENSPQVNPISFQPVFKDKLYFVYLNRKQNSRTAIENYKKTKNKSSDIIPILSQLTLEIANTDNWKEFAQLIEKHEKIVSEALGLETIQKTLFSDFKGNIKSLGAWGGDFILVVSDSNPKEYFDKKGFKTILTFQEMIQ